jgi:hypothetical protein
MAAAFLPAKTTWSARWSGPCTVPEGVCDLALCHSAIESASSVRKACLTTDTAPPGTLRRKGGPPQGSANSVAGEASPGAGYAVAAWVVAERAREPDGAFNEEKAGTAQLSVRQRPRGRIWERCYGPTSRAANSVRGVEGCRSLTWPSPTSTTRHTPSERRATSVVTNRHPRRCTAGLM